MGWGPPCPYYRWCGLVENWPMLRAYTKQIYTNKIYINIWALFTIRYRKFGDCDCAHFATQNVLEGSKMKLWISYFLPGESRTTHPPPPPGSKRRSRSLLSSLVDTSFKRLFLCYSWTEYDETSHVHSFDQYKGRNWALFSTFDPGAPWGPKTAPKRPFF